MIKNAVCQKIKESGIVAVIRAASSDMAMKLVAACLSGGIDVIEITFTVPGASQVIRQLRERPTLSSMMVGAGSIMDLVAAREALDAGASFIVGPGYDPKVARVCVDRQVPYLPGCFTVTEMMTAMKAGAEIIKLFPGSLAGPEYVKAIRGPLPKIQLMPTGGVSLDNIQDWFDAGVVAVGVGGEITSPARSQDYDAVKERAQAFVKRIQQVRQASDNR